MAQNGNDGNTDIGALNDMFSISGISRAGIKPELVQKNKYVKDAVRGTGVYWTEISSRSPFHTLSYGDDFKIWVNDQVQRKKKYAFKCF